MSEYQYIAFRAIDAPVSRENLRYMRRQSTRAEITPTSFDNEYSFGDFHGSTLGMLRRGYDFHLHFADFGIRKLMFHFPGPLPDIRAAQNYYEGQGVCHLKDPKGPGGILSFEPFFEAGDLEDYPDIPDLIDRLLPLRAELVDGDLRPLYIAHLAVCSDMDHDPETSHEGPLPAGLDKPTDAQRALAEFLGLDRKTLSAAARNIPGMPKPAEAHKEFEPWIKALPETKKNKWLAKLMKDAESDVRRDILAEFRKSHPSHAWPTISLNRTIAELRAGGRKKSSARISQNENENE